MASAIDSSNIGKGKVPETIATIFPLGSVLYPTETEDINESAFEKSTLNKMKIDVLKALEKGTKKIGEAIFENIPIPDRFERKEIYEKWEEETSKVYGNLIKQVKEKDIDLSKEDKMLIENIGIIRKIELAIDNNDRDKLVRSIENYQKHINDNFKHLEKALFSIRRKYSKIYFESKLKPAYMTSISKVINTLISYFYYLDSELNSVLSIFRQLINKRIKLETVKKKTKAVFTRIVSLDLIEFELLLQLMYLQLFMEIWSSKNKDELFKPKTKYDNNLIDNEHFDKILNDLNKMSDKLHYKIIEITRERKKEIPFTFSNNINDKNEEKMQLFSRIIHRV